MGEALRTGEHNDLTDVAGVAVGHHHKQGLGWMTGTTVVIPPPGTVGSVDVRGGGPATRETDALAPDTMVQDVDAICLSGGSAFGLDAAGGVMAHLAEIGRGFPVGPDAGQVVPIVPAAALFDLGTFGSFDLRPDAEFGRRAAAVARTVPVPQGNVGAGTGATAGVLKGGVGSASVVSTDGVTVAALVALNPAGSPVDPSSGRLWAADRLLAGEFEGLHDPSPVEVEAYREALLGAGRAPFNTTLVVVATDAGLTKPECHRLAIAGQDGLARAIDPIHAYVDGDVVFALATGDRELPTAAESGPPRPAGGRLLSLLGLGALAADAVSRAVVHATLATETVGTHRSYKDMFPSAFPAN
ncbi:MAG: P1 family peptidase [Acidimicrobiales bacterium]|nr:P1 family peptidase [Acidimicrobiales bacterium]